MALEPGTLAQAFESALGSIRQAGTAANIGAIAKSLQEKFGSMVSNPYIDFLNVVRSADAAWRQASVMEADGNQVDRGRTVPIDPTLNRAEGLYQYRVVVITTDARGNTRETIVVVDSNEPLSGDAARADAIDQVSSGAVVNDTNPKGGFDPSNVTYSAVVVSAGRAR